MPSNAVYKEYCKKLAYAKNEFDRQWQVYQASPFLVGKPKELSEAYERAYEKFDIAAREARKLITEPLPVKPCVCARRLDSCSYHCHLK